MAGNGGAPDLGSSVEGLKQTEAAVRKLEYAEYLLKNPLLRDILCFERTLPKNLVYIRLALVFRNLKPEWVVFRLVELGLYTEVIIDSYRVKECKKECLEKRGRKCLEYTTVCEEVDKNIEGLMPSDELINVCKRLGALI